MASLNKVMLMGNLTRDPELKVTPKGASICSFSLAINRKFKLEDGTVKEEVVFVDIDAWGKQGETIAKYTSRGKPLYVEGRLRLESWEDKNTKEKRSRMKVTLEQFQFIGVRDDAPDTGGSPSASSPGPSPERHAPPARSTAPQPRPAQYENLDEDVPF